MHNKFRKPVFLKNKGFSGKKMIFRLFFRKTDFLNLLCNYDNFLWQILKIQVISVDLRCICYNTTPGAEVLNSPLNIGLQKWVIFTIFTLLQLDNLNFFIILARIYINTIHTHPWSPTSNPQYSQNCQFSNFYPWKPPKWDISPTSKWAF